jgi:hypothetical protein
MSNRSLTAFMTRIMDQLPLRGSPTSVRVLDLAVRARLAAGNDLKEPPSLADVRDTVARD